MDDAGVVPRVDDGDDGRGKPSQILRATDIGQRRVLLESSLERHRIGDAAARDRLADRLVDAGMAIIGEMLRQQEFGNAVERLVVREQGTEQLLLGFQVHRRAAIARLVWTRARKDRDRVRVGHG